MLKEKDLEKIVINGLKKAKSLKQVYKYINLSDGIEYVLGKNTFKFSNPKEFNDPFDCYEKLINITIDKK